MNILAWFEPLLSDGVVHRLESCAEVNKRAARESFRTERAYWQGQLYHAETPEQVKAAREELDKLDELAILRRL